MLHLSYFIYIITLTILYHLAFLRGCECQLVINVKNQGGDIVQESITSNITDDTITLEFQRPEGTLITQFIDFKSVTFHLLDFMRILFIYFFLKCYALGKSSDSLIC